MRYVEDILCEIKERLCLIFCNGEVAISIGLMVSRYYLPMLNSPQSSRPCRHYLRWGDQEVEPGALVKFLDQI